MNICDIIEKKRDGGILNKEEISFFIEGYTKGEIPDYQASALVMACYIRGMNDQETVDLTLSMMNSGDVADLTRLGEFTADKHSTGGVGDKTTLIVAPLAAALGLKIAKMSGRGLGHTGGTVDKLESIKGYKTELTPEEFIQQVENIGIAVVGQTGNFAPADKKLYALRDVTATVSSIPLIASSIMSKKIAAGAKTIVLDVKYGSGAFMKTKEDATLLAEEMVKIGNMCGRNTAALITNMDVPLGTHIGNSLEVKEAIGVLKGEEGGNLREICLNLASKMRSKAFCEDFEVAYQKAAEILDSGKAYEKFIEWISNQGGDVLILDDLQDHISCDATYSFKAKEEGYIKSVDAELIGRASAALGGGREKLGEKIDFSAGLILRKTLGDYVKIGEEIAELRTSSHTFDRALEFMERAYIIGKEPPEKQTLIYKTI